MASSKNFLYSFSFSSEDCKYVTAEGGHVFEMQAHQPRMQSVKVALGTIELPLSQFPIERMCSRIHFAESYTFDIGQNTLVVEELTSSSSSGPHTKETYRVEFPIHLNEIADFQANAGIDGTVDIEVTTKNPHNLWVLPTDATGQFAAAPLDELGANLANWWWLWDPIRIVATCLGAVAFHPKNMQFVNDTTFRVLGATCQLGVANAAPAGGGGPSKGWVYTPAVPGPLHIALLLENALLFSGTHQRFSVGTSSVNAGLVIFASSISFPPTKRGTEQCASLRVTCNGDGFATAVGLSGVSVVWQLVHAMQPQSTMSAFGDATAMMIQPNVSSQAGVFRIKGALSDNAELESLHDNMSFKLSGQRYDGGVGVAELPIGWYDLSTRPVGVTGTHVFTKSWFQALQPLHFPYPTAPMHQYYDANRILPLVSPFLLVFTDTNSFRHIVPIIMGMHTPAGLAEYLTASMSALAAANGAAGVVVQALQHPTGHRGSVRFVFATANTEKSNNNNLLSPPGFGLLFKHQASTVNATVFGFDDANYTGLHTYIAPRFVSVPNLSTSGEARPTQGIWSAKVLRETRQLQFSCDPVSSECFVSSVRTTQGHHLAQITVCTAGGQPWNPGIVEGQLVSLRRFKPGIANGKPSQVLRRVATQVGYDWVEWESFDGSAGVTSIPNIDLVQARVVAAPDGSVDAIDRVYTLTLDVGCMLGALVGDQVTWVLEPIRALYPSLFFGQDFRHSINPSILGFPPKLPTCNQDGQSCFDALQRQQLRQTAFGYGTAGDVSLSASASPLCTFPISGWSIYRIDPPEILLLELNHNKMKSSMFLQHTDKSNITTPFARLNLSSLFREGGTRAEVYNSSTESLTVFELGLRNPDGSPYQNHGAIFTFTINVYSST